jgi:type III secretory pathway component EscR
MFSDRIRDERHTSQWVWSISERVCSPIVQWLSVGFDFLRIVFFFNCHSYRGLFKVNPKMTIFGFDLENEISVCSPVVIITLTEVFDRTVSSKIIFPSPWNPYLKTDGTSLLILFLVMNFEEKEIYFFEERFCQKLPSNNDNNWACVRNLELKTLILVCWAKQQ